MVKRIILITGFAHDGKSTLANKIAQEQHINIYALADVLKEMTKDVYNLMKIPFPSRKEDVRYFYQHLGTEICRKHFGEDIWCEVLDKKIANDPNEWCIISDVRFLNEHAYFLRKYPNSITIRARCKNRIPIWTGNHASEQDIEKIHADFVYEWTQNIFDRQP